MKHAVLSDVHGNLEALEAVLEDVEAAGASRIWSLGDAVGCIQQHDPRIPARQQASGQRFQAAVRKRHGEKRVPFAILAMLTHVEKRNLLAVGQRGLDLVSAQIVHERCQSPALSMVFTPMSMIL